MFLRRCRPSEIVSLLNHVAHFGLGGILPIRVFRLILRFWVFIGLREYYWARTRPGFPFLFFGLICGSSS